ncbi:MAG TPA: S8/S53 family peptidase [Mycobacteriales bacterium]|nr:S8/S53 family peptidase [Mycobacteriales bacterium]
MDRITLLNHIQGLPLNPPRPVAPLDPAKVAAALPAYERTPYRTTVAVLDSGVARHWYVRDQLYPVGGADDATEQWDLAEAVLPRQIGHGTFVAGVVRQYAPYASILARRVIDRDGESHDQMLAAAIRELVDYSPDVLNLSLGPGRHADEEDAATPTPQTAAAIARLQDVCGTIVVIAAGYRNDLWPQVELAAPGERTVIVGAWDPAAERRAGFSDDRDVEIWAPGVGVVSSFLYWEGLVELGTTDDAAEPGVAAESPRLRFDGWARWDGTSFAAPAVSGAIAAAIGAGCSQRTPHERRLVGLEEVRDAAKTIDGDRVLAASPTLPLPPP